MKEIPFIWKGAQMKCLIDGCDSIANARGLCQVCYMTATTAVKKGTTSWGQLEELGLANKPQHRGRGYGAFTKALSKKIVSNNEV